MLSLPHIFDRKMLPHTLCNGRILLPLGSCFAKSDIWQSVTHLDLKWYLTHCVKVRMTMEFIQLDILQSLTHIFGRKHVSYIWCNGKVLIPLGS